MCRESLIDFNKYVISENGQIFSKYKKDYMVGTSNRRYRSIELRCIDGKSRWYSVHRVIYYFFNGEIPEGMQVNHIDENPANNSLSNLSLLTQEQNNNWGTRNERIAASKRGKPRSEKFKTHLKTVRTKYHVLQYDLETSSPIKLWLNTHEIERETGYNQSLIYYCCKGGHFNNGRWQNNTQAYGYGWKFTN